MKICYVDESGGFEAPNHAPDSTPIMVISGVILDHRVLQSLTIDFLAVKERFFPGRCKRPPGRHLEHIRAEIKGSEIRDLMRSRSRRKRRLAIGFLDQVVSLLERYDARIVGRLWVKAPTQGMKPGASYAFAIQDIAQHFNHLLVSTDDIGVLLCDGRQHNQDADVSHSIFTQKHQVAGDALPRLVEAPMFGRSESHVGLQLADAVASALLFPIGTRTYCAGSCTSAHAHVRFDELRTRYSRRLKALTHTYTVEAQIKGGIVVSDKMGHKSSGQMFRLP